MGANNAFWETALFPLGKMMASHHDRVHADGWIHAINLLLFALDFIRLVSMSTPF